MRQVCPLSPLLIWNSQTEQEDKNKKWKEFK
jgi:hypothetical protein